MKRIALSGKYGKNKFALVDDEDFERASKYRWYVDIKGYVVYKHRQSNLFLRLHRLVMNTPNGLFTDHINHNHLDNRKCNLRICTIQQNNINKIKKENLTSIYNGVHWNTINKCWKVTVGVFFVGCFKNDLHAAMARDIWAKEIQGEFAVLNFN